MKTRLWLIVTFTAIYLLGFLLPLILLMSMGADVSVNTAASVSASVAGFLTLVIAVLFYDKFGLGKTQFDKSLDQVMKLIDELCKIRITARLDDIQFLFITFSKPRISHLRLIIKVNI
jgi:hypothetical protein